MKHRKFTIKGLIEFNPRIFDDQRGNFFESYRQEMLEKLGLHSEFVQDNQSFSIKNVLRGIHFQAKPYEQAKLVRVVTGKVLDVAVDLRPDSETFGRHIATVLDSSRNNMLFIPEGFGHGFLALEDCILQYKCTEYYYPGYDKGIFWNDPDLKINWGITNPEISEKDAALPSFQSFKQNII